MRDVRIRTLMLMIFLVIAKPLRAEYPKAHRETVVASPRTIELLKTYLASDDPRERSEALGMLRQVRDPKAADAVRRLANDPDPRVRAQVLLTLEALVGAPELVPILQEKCGDQSPLVARQALGILGGTPGRDAFAALTQVRPTLAPEVLDAWALALASRDEPVPSAIVSELLRATDPSLRAAAVQIVAAHPKTIELSRRFTLLDDEHWLVRARAIAALRDARDDARVRDAVIERLNDSSSLVRRSALEWLEGATVELRTFEARLEDADPTVRIAAVHAVGRLPGADAATKLIDRLSDRELLVAVAASDQLGARGDASLADSLIGLLKDQPDQVIRLSARSLGLMKSTDASEHLQALAGHPAESVRSAAYEALGRIGQPNIVPWLLETVNKETGFPRAAINESLGRLKDTRALAHLISDCHYPDEKSNGLNPALFTPMSQPPTYLLAATAAATAAVRALGELGDVRAVPALVLVSRDVLRNEAFWTGVVSSLGKLGDVRARPALLELGAAGYISQGMAMIELPTTTRIEALRAIATLHLADAADEMLAIDPTRCALELRRVAADALTALTGQKYMHRLPARQGAFFIEDGRTDVDLSAFKLPVCYRVEDP